MQESLQEGVPKGIFQKLASFEGSQLGNNRTKRLLLIEENNDVLVGALTIWEKRPHCYTYYNFILDNQDKVWVIGGHISEESQGSVSGGVLHLFNPLHPPSFTEILREISQAERRQLTLKRRDRIE